MKDCSNSYKDNYKKTHTLSLATGFGLTPEDRQTGIQTIEQKLNTLCCHYQAMHELMGNKAFVNPLYKVDAQKDVETTNPSDSDSSDDSDDSDNSEDSDDSDNSDNSDNGKEKDSDNASV
jgi:DNA-directed RNA polymerase specialized sigma54-like protein